METPVNPVGREEHTGLSREVQHLRTQLKINQFLTVALTVAVGLLVFRERQFQRRTIEVQALSTQRAIDDLSRMNKLVAELQRYGTIHTNYIPVLRRHGLEPVAGTNAVAPARPAATR